MASGWGLLTRETSHDQKLGIFSSTPSSREGRGAGNDPAYVRRLPQNPESRGLGKFQSGR